MKQAATLELFSYWNSIRGDRAAPERADIDPGAIRSVLADTFMLEVDPALSFPMRLVGARMNALFVRELKGRSFVDLWTLPNRKSVVETLLGVLDESMPASAGVLAAPAGRPLLDLEMLLLPLRHNGKTHARILGCMTPHATPSWLGLVPVVGLDLKTVRLTPPMETEGTSPANDPGWRSPVRRAHLRVHIGGRSES